MMTTEPTTPLNNADQGGTFFIGEDLMRNIKKPTTFKEQVQILRSRGLIIDDEQAAVNMLQNINYYRLSAYLLSYKDKNGCYHKASIDDVYSLYTFDKRLRNLILPMLEDIEIAFRTHIAYQIAHNYGPLGYEDSQNFKNADYHKEMLNVLEDEIQRSKEVFVGHHKRYYDGNLPVWVVIELVAFGVLSKIYNNLLDEDKDKIAKSYYNTKSEFISTWLHSLSTLRNICAHHGRLYNKKLTVTPKLYKKDKQLGIENNALFSNIYVMGKLLKKREAWEHFVARLANLIERYRVVDLKCMGFPSDWEDVLKTL